MTREEQMDSCEICEFHKIIECGGNFRIMSCHYGEYKNHPVWCDFQCPLGDKRPIREEDENTFIF